MIFAGTSHCLTRLHCVACRTDAAWRESLRKAGLVESADFDCPYGVTSETAPAIQAAALAKLPGQTEIAVALAKQKEEMDKQGRAAWAWLHAEAEKDALTPDRERKEFRPMIPRYGCSCTAEWDAILKKAPPMPTIGQKQWAIDRHNDVNLKLGKPVWLPPTTQA